MEKLEREKEKIDRVGGREKRKIERQTMREMMNR